MQSDLENTIQLLISCDHNARCFLVAKGRSALITEVCGETSHLWAIFEIQFTGILTFGGHH